MILPFFLVEIVDFWVYDLWKRLTLRGLYRSGDILWIFLRSFALSASKKTNRKPLFARVVAQRWKHFSWEAQI